MSRTLKLSATKPQAEFHRLECKYPLFVGGYGSGKTEAMLNQAIMDASISSSSLVALYAPTYDLVKLIILPRLIVKLNELGIRHTVNKSDYIIFTSESGFGDFILRTLDKPERIVGYESFRAHVDELDTLSMAKATDAWNKVIARNRQVVDDNPTLMNRVCAYTTPEGFRFAYTRWKKQKNAEYARVHASSHSNPFLPDGYIDSLYATYPETLADAYIKGEFTNLQSGTVYNVYNREKHRSAFEIRESETLYIGCDFNVTKQAATIYVKRKNEETNTIEWHAVDELVDMYDTPEMIQKIQGKWTTSKIVIYPDATGAKRATNDASVSDIALLEDAGFSVRAHKTNPRVKDRVMAMNAALDKGLVFINDIKCPTVANCLEQQVYTDKGEPDKSAGNDHQNDATTYPIAYEFPISRPVIDINAGFVI